MYIITIIMFLAGCVQPAPTPEASDVPRWRVEYRVIRHADDSVEDDGLPDPCGLESVDCPHE